jgi:hypothetical protein
MTPFDHYTLARRLALKRQEAINYLGTKWILHPANRVKRKSADSQQKR